MTPTQRLSQEVARQAEWQVGLQNAADTYADEPVGVLLKEIARKHAAHVTRLAEIAKEVKRLEADRAELSSFVACLP